jgi:hypothetical protein
MVAVVVKVSETITEVTNVCMIEDGVGIGDVEVTGTILLVGEKDEVVLVATGAAGF